VFLLPLPSLLSLESLLSLLSTKCPPPSAQAHGSAVPASPTQTQKLAGGASTTRPLLTPLSPHHHPHRLADPPPTPTHQHQPARCLPPHWVPPSSVEVPFLPQTPVLAVSRAQFGFPEDQATSQTRPVNSQGVPRGGVVPNARCSACVGCLWCIPTQKNAKKNSLLGALAPSGGRLK
jgi:hypothetical protein